LSGLNPSKPGPRTKNGAGKRPPPRGEFNNYNRNLDKQNFPAHQVDQADEWELGSLYNSGGKKPNYNHLLNFQYSQRGNTRGQQQPAQRYGKKKQREEERRPRYDHTHYLQANCQFIVRSGESYSIQAADPDVLVDWSLIEQVNLKVTSDDATACPICLFPPTAGKMSECGHVFCWACILHYLALSDDKWRPCPICHQDVSKQGLRSVKVFSQHNFSTGEGIKMTLMKRERNSLFAVPVSQKFMQDNPEITNMEVDKSFVKLLTANPEQIKKEILTRERMELEKQWEEEKDQPEACFIQEALKLLDERQMETMLRPKVKKIKSPITPEPTMPGFQSLSISSPTSPKSYVDPFAEETESVYVTEAENREVSQADTSDMEERPRHTSGVSLVSSDSVSSGSGEEVILEEDVTVTDLDISTVQAEPVSGQPRQVFYFYQSSDGQPIYLHALNVQMLVKEFGALENCPPVIEAEILEKEGAVMSAQMRDRLRYLKHLPVSTNFEVAELDLSNLVSKVTLSVFKDQVDARKRKRNRKLRDEKRREKKIEHEEARRLGFPGSMRRVESEYFSKSSAENQVEQFPSMSGNEALAQDSGSASGISFANITRTKPVATPTPTPAPASSTWACLGSVKPLRGVTRAPLTGARNTDSEPEEGGEDYAPPPPAASLGDTLAAALLAADGKTNNKGKKGGKKGRGKTLLLTGGAPRPNM